MAPTTRFHSGTLVAATIMILAGCSSSTAKSVPTTQRPATTAGSPTTAASSAIAPAPTTVTGTPTTPAPTPTTATHTTTTIVVTTTAPTPTTIASTGVAQLTFKGDQNASLDSPNTVKCSTNPATIVVSGLAGGSGITLTITATTIGATTTFPGPVTAKVVDDIGGPQYSADATGGTGSGTLMINTDGSGQIDLALAYVNGSAGTFKGGTIIATGSWSCNSAPPPATLAAAATAGPADVCELLTIDEAATFTGVTMAKDDSGAAECVYDGTNSSRVYVQRTTDQTTANLPTGIPAITGLGDAAVGNDSTIDVLIGRTRFTIGANPPAPPGALLSLATTIINRIHH